MVIILHFIVMGLNLYFAKIQKNNGGNPAFTYFIAGMCFGFGLFSLIKLLLK